MHAHIHTCTHRCIKMALVHDLAESIVGDITPSCGVSKDEKHRREKVYCLLGGDCLSGGDCLLLLGSDFPVTVREWLTVAAIKS